MWGKIQDIWMLRWGGSVGDDPGHLDAQVWERCWVPSPLIWPITCLPPLVKITADWDNISAIDLTMSSEKMVVSKVSLNLGTTSLEVQGHL